MDDDPPPSGTGESPNTDEHKENKGKLILDATCAPADIRYPTDLSLLNEAREKLEAIITPFTCLSKVLSTNQELTG